MTIDQLFQLSNLGVLPFWLLLIFVPRLPWAVRIVRSPFIAIVPALIYVVLIVPLVIQLGPSLFRAFGSVNGVMQLLASPTGTTVAWAHLLTFDLLIGRWAYLDALERGISSLAMAPVLVFIVMLGPLGFVFYLIARVVHRPRRKISS